MPIGIYLFALFVGYQVIRLFTIEVEEKGDKSLVTTDYLNGELPSANVSSDLGSKRKNMQHSFGYITDNSAVQNIVDDTDSLRKKEDYDSKYSDDELAALERQAQEAEEKRKMEELQGRLQQSGRQAQAVGEDDFVLPMSDEERALALQQRRSREMDEMETALGLARANGRGRLLTGQQALPDSTIQQKEVSEAEDNPDAVNALDDDAENQIVVKKKKDSGDYFNTLSENEAESHLIKAIIDEEVKVTEGSRIRLRLLDDIEIGDIPMKKGSYLYATMSGFSKQRAKGKVESVMLGDDLFKVSLFLYDTDGLEGLYVPGSQFMETVRDVGSSAMQGNMNINDGSYGNNMEQFAMQGLQNAYRRTSNAISKAIKKNKVRLKYGTQVYLVNGKDKKRK